ncbi:MAG: DUF3243 domain-containing protein [Bacillota bacterium]|nr:DUF3243 domain-containing protein [Bacillota bacterium]
MSVLKNFSQWKQFLNEKIDQAQAAGVSDQMIQNIAYEIGDYLAKNIDPQNNEERLLKELWDVGDENEQRTLAGLMVKLVDQK